MAKIDWHVARISYGKDSMKMLEVIRSRGLPLDQITTTDVWATDTIPANLPPVQEFKDRMDQWIWDQYRIEVDHLCARNKDGSKRTYEQMFYHVPKRKNSQSVQVERERRIGASAIQGFPVLGRPWCQTVLKKRVSPPWRIQGEIIGWPPNTGYNWCAKLKYSGIRHQGVASQPENSAMVPGSQDPTAFRRQSLPGAGNSRFSDERLSVRRRDINIIEYIGIAADEPKRFGQLSHKLRAPLVEFGVDEELCGLYCRYAGCLSPTYESSFRDGCWFCHNQGVDQLRLLRKNYPDLWALMLKWDLDSPKTFKADGHTVHDYDQRFRAEEEGFVPVGRNFRWSMLDGPMYAQTSLF